MSHPVTGSKFSCHARAKFVLPLHTFNGSLASVQFLAEQYCLFYQGLLLPLDSELTNSDNSGQVASLVTFLVWFLFETITSRSRLNHVL